jgi:hypothetical protein
MRCKVAPDPFRNLHHQFPVSPNPRAILVLGRNLSGNIQAGTDRYSDRDAGDEFFSRDAFATTPLLARGGSQGITAGLGRVLGIELHDVFAWLEFSGREGPVRVRGALERGLS